MVRLTARDAALLEAVDSFQNVSLALLEQQVESGTTESSRVAAAEALSAARRLREQQQRQQQQHSGGDGSASGNDDQEQDSPASLTLLEHKARSWSALAQQRHRPPPTPWMPNHRTKPLLVLDGPQQQEEEEMEEMEWAAHGASWCTC